MSVIDRSEAAQSRVVIEFVETCTIRPQHSKAARDRRPNHCESGSSSLFKPSSSCEAAWLQGDCAGESGAT